MIILCPFTRMVGAIKKSSEYFGYENIRKRKKWSEIIWKEKMFCFVHELEVAKV